MNGSYAPEIQENIDLYFRRHDVKSGELMQGYIVPHHGSSLDGHHRVGRLQYTTKCEHAKYCWECPPEWADRCKYGR